MGSCLITICKKQKLQDFFVNLSVTVPKSAKLCRVCKCLLLTEGMGSGWPPIAIVPEPSSADDQMVPPVPIAFGGIKDTRGRKSMTDNLGVNYEFRVRSAPGQAGPHSNSDDGHLDGPADHSGIRGFWTKFVCFFF